MKMILCTFMIILIFFANLSEEKSMNGGKEVKSLSGFGAIIQTENSKAQSRHNREFLSSIFNTDFQFCVIWAAQGSLGRVNSSGFLLRYVFYVFMGTFLHCRVCTKTLINIKVKKNDYLFFF